MAALTGRTTYKWANFIIHCSAATLRAIPFNSLSVCGVTYEETDLTAFQDAVRGALPSMPDAPIEWGGPFDSKIAAVLPTLSGSHTILSGVCGLAVPLTIDIQFGIRAAWVAGAPNFGITAVADTNGYLVTKYVVDLTSMLYSARAVLFPGSALPAWGIAAHA
jgi:hypothetical protein